MGPGMESTSAVTAWDPPRKWAAQSDGWIPGMPPLANEWSVEARGGGLCIVRLVQSLFASTDDWDNQLEASQAAGLAAQKERAERGFREGRFSSWQEVKRENGL